MARKQQPPRDLTSTEESVLDHLRQHGACRIVEAEEALGLHPQTVQAALCVLRERKLIIKAQIAARHYYGIATEKYRFKLEMEAIRNETGNGKGEDEFAAHHWADQPPNIRVVREWQFEPPKAPKWVFDLGAAS